MRLHPQRDTPTVVILRSSLSLLSFLLLVSCGSDPLEGRVILSGSSTLAPVVAPTVAQWNTLHPRVEVRVESMGSDAGLERLIKYNDADVAMLSRSLSDEDRAVAQAAGKSLLAFPLAWDAVSLVVPASNTWAQGLTSEQAALAFTTAALWSDLDASWPELAVHRFVPGPVSGTSDIFAARLLGGEKGRLYGPRVQASEDDEILVRGLAQVEGSIGFLGWSTVQDSRLALRVLSLDGVEPAAPTIRDRTYGLTRQLWLVADTTSWKTHPALRSLVHYLYDQYSDLVAGTPLVPLTEDERRSVDALINETLLSNEP